MKVHALAFAAGLVVLSATQAFSEKLLIRMSPKGLKDAGFSVRTTRQDDGAVQFCFTRDTRKAEWQSRSATLEVRNAAGLVLRCSLEPHKMGSDALYYFTLARDHIAHSELTISEIQGGEDEVKLLGGGTLHRFRLADFYEVK